MVHLAPAAPSKVQLPLDSKEPFFFLFQELGSSSSPASETNGTRTVIEIRWANARSDVPRFHPKSGKKSRSSDSKAQVCI